ncbi:MAG TPA: glutathionylspermidine synthase family protein [Humisphaera sp.]|jgi:glutathionylspermidine synthase|nr:glutathionylspermidine synthase family protein [Humisphaera sp.]
MRRIQTNPRPNWQKTVESQGFHFHTADEQPYWDESVYYQFTAQEIVGLEKATYALNEMCLAAVQHVIDNNLFEQFLIPQPFWEWVKKSWDRDEITIYGRFDFAYDGAGPPKLLEYNADTPTSLLEAAVIQWYWLQDKFPKLDQFNSIHERLIEAWKRVKPTEKIVHFTALRGHLEDYMTTAYLRDTAMQAGLTTEYLDVEAIGWNNLRKCFVDSQERHIGDCFKLYPWEWMVREAFGTNLLLDNTRWLEAPWKMILSNKAILPILWELYPENPHLLRAQTEPLAGNYVRKPILGREGSNIQVVIDNQTVFETEGIYGEPFVYQQHALLPTFDGNYPVIGSWMVNGYACGMGVREDNSPVIHNTSRFVPHVIEG